MPTDKTYEFVRIPRNELNNFWFLSWPEVIAAAEAGDGGLAFEAPPFSPMLPTRPERGRYPDDAKGAAMFEKDAKNYDRSIDAAYVHEGNDSWGKGKTLLYQQNWAAALFFGV